MVTVEVELYVSSPCLWLFYFLQGFESLTGAVLATFFDLYEDVSGLMRVAQELFEARRH